MAFVGKLIVSKGVDLLLARLAARAGPGAATRGSSSSASAPIAGRFEALAAALAAGDLGARARIGAGARAGGRPAASSPTWRRSSIAWRGERRAICEAARALADPSCSTGRLEHGELADVLPACRGAGRPSTFPEAFGMVAAEAAACGTLPVSADHSGLAEVSKALAASLPDEARHLVSFGLGDGAVDELAERLIAWLDTPEAMRKEARASLVATARERYSWAGVARNVIAAAEGRLEELPAP